MTRRPKHMCYGCNRHTDLALALYGGKAPGPHCHGEWDGRADRFWREFTCACRCNDGSKKLSEAELDELAAKRDRQREAEWDMRLASAFVRADRALRDEKLKDMLHEFLSRELGKS